MTNCDLIRDLMPLYADGQASPVSRRTIEDHAAECPQCQKLLDDMCITLEPEPEDSEEQILERLYKKQRRKTILSWAAIALALVLAAWAFLEVNFSGELIYASSTSEKRIMKEVPELALTDAELALAQTIPEIPEIQDFLANGKEDSIVLDTQAMMPHMGAVVPENGRVVEIFIFRTNIYISIIDGNRSVTLCYCDIDRSGHIDLITKTYAISPLDEIGEDGYLGDVKAVYELYHAPGTNLTKVQKIKSRHMWFSFLEFWD